MTIEDLKRIKKDFPGNQVIIRLGSGRRIILRRSTDLGVTDTKIVFNSGGERVDVLPADIAAAEFLEAPKAP